MLVLADLYRQSAGLLSLVNSWTVGLSFSLQALDWVCFVKISLLLLILNGQYSAYKKSIENIDNEEH